MLSELESSLSRNSDEKTRDEIRENIKNLDQIVDQILREKEYSLVSMEVDVILNNIEIFYLKGSANK